MSFVGSSMHSRAAELVKLLDMRPHPEGGHYAEVFRSAHRVQVLDRNVERAALTAIELLLFDDQGLRRMPLGAVEHATRSTIVVPAGTWQAARSTGAYTLVGCAVGPGFEFADFSLAVDRQDIAARIADAGPDLARFI